MKTINLTIILISLMCCTKSISQEAFKKVYYIQNTISYPNDSVIYLQKTSKIKYKDFSKVEQDSLRK